MGSKYRNSFFDAKREWSKYKDAVLDYYLVPYLQKVKDLRKPICVVDMFAGRGEFLTGEPGSPLIIAKRLKELADDGHEVKLLCYENWDPFFLHLKDVLKPYPFAQAIPQDCFSDVESIAQTASTHTMLLYIDPLDVVQLNLRKLKLVFDKVRQNSSVEALIVFMARAFMRQAALARSMEMKIAEALNDPLIEQAEADDKAMWLDVLYGDETVEQHARSQKHQTLLTEIAGGTYWQAIVQDQTSSWNEKCLRLVDEYRKKLGEWFKLVEALAVSPDTSPIPKYWIVFMSRYKPALDLFNRAACDMVRTQYENIQSNTLFAGVDVGADVVPSQQVDRAVKRAAQPLTSCEWQELRWRTCGGRNIGMFTDSEINQSIKRLLKDRWLSGASGDRIENKAILTPTPKLKGWTER